MNTQEKIASLEKSIANLKKYLQYADGQAYYNDRREIQRLEKQLWELRSNGIR